MFRVSGIARRAFGRVLDNGDIYFGDLPGIIPPEYYGDMEKVGIWTGFYELVQGQALDFISNVNELGYGYGVGIVGLSLIFRGLWAPFILYSQSCSIKMQLIAPETQEHREKLKQAYKQGDRQLASRLTEQYSQLKRKFKIYPGLQSVPLTQVPFVLSFFWTLQDMTYNIEKYPSMEHDGFLWFKNLTEPDPYYILPACLAFSTFLTAHKSPSNNQNFGQISQLARYFKYLSFLALPVTSTFPSAIVLNWFIMSALQLSINQLVYTKTGRKIIGIPEFLPGTILEQKNVPQERKVIKPKIYKTNPLKNAKKNQ